MQVIGALSSFQLVTMIYRPERFNIWNFSEFRSETACKSKLLYIVKEDMTTPALACMQNKWKMTPLSTAMLISTMKIIYENMVSVASYDVCIVKWR